MLKTIKRVASTKGLQFEEDDEDWFNPDKFSKPILPYGLEKGDVVDVVLRGSFYTKIEILDGVMPESSNEPKITKSKTPSEDNSDFSLRMFCTELAVRLCVADKIFIHDMNHQVTELEKMVRAGK